jgi:rifampicin phosphotransferase
MIYSFSTDLTPTLDQVGGKARSLIDATAAGFRVPAGIVLSVDFFRPWTEAIESSEVWAAFLGSSEAELRPRCEAIKVRCQGLRFGAAQQEALWEALTGLHPDGLFAVRSSSPEEDLEGSSFAGEYETTLGVTGPGLENAILNSFASVFDDRVVRYKLQRDLRVDRPRIAVVVQEQIASDCSGVAFSLNPLNNCYDEAVINANFGLGETVVAGVVTPDSWVVDKTHREIVDKKIANKAQSLQLLAGGGTVEQTNESTASPSLTDSQALEVADLAARAEEHAARPMDIEWAFEGGTLYLLQSRPITTYLALPDQMVTRPGTDKFLYLDVIVLSQGFSDSLSVLGAELWGGMVEAFKGETMFDRGMDGTLLNIDGRQYLHLSNLMKGMGSGVVPKMLSTYDKPTRKIFEAIDLKKDYLPAAKPDAVKGMVWAVLGRVFKVLPGVYQGFRNPEESRRRYDRRTAAALAECRQMVADERPFDELTREFMVRFGDLSKEMAAVLMPPMLARWRLGRLFRDDDVGDLLVALEMDLEGNPTSQMGHRMYELASFPEIRSTLGGEEFARRIEAREYSPELLQAYDTYMEQFGLDPVPWTD